KIDESSYGPDHPKVAIRLNNLGLVLQDLGELAKARKLLTRALTIFGVSNGPDHPSTRTVRENLRTLDLPKQ
ncbi:MAG TPA: tetratricopeptide repeat protein, partial [Longimicrobiaceae bacterium]|nr:tetratricopeptide repeat protein [Longimicrobiaceae bacterium]